jgi:Ca2+-binding RTX toxin-like protein
VADPDDDWTFGTEGDDVIVGKGELSVSIVARGGNDVICIDNGYVYAGDGDDSILATGAGPEETIVDAELGEGDDVYVGGRWQDYVDHDTGVPGTDFYSPGTDSISTGAGKDTVGSRPPPNEPNHDVVDLGAGGDWLSLELPAGSSAQVQGGIGPDHMDLAGVAVDYAVDLGTGAVTRAGVEAASFSGFEDYWLWVVGPGELRVVGTPGHDQIVVAAERLDLRLGDGPDVVQIDSLGEGSPGVPASGVVDLGPGKDLLEAGAARLMVADLARGRLTLRTSSKHHGELALFRVEKIYGAAHRVVMRGGPASDTLSGFGCHVRLRGGAGADHLHAGPSFPPGGNTCFGVIVGGAGHDLLKGGKANDRLLGGPGNDEARGYWGTDTCRAERETSCEL